MARGEVAAHALQHVCFYASSTSSILCSLSERLVRTLEGLLAHSGCLPVAYLVPVRELPEFGGVARVQWSMPRHVCLGHFALTGRVAPMGMGIDDMCVARGSRVAS